MKTVCRAALAQWKERLTRNGQTRVQISKGAYFLYYNGVAAIRANAGKQQCRHNRQWGHCLSTEGSRAVARFLLVGGHAGAMLNLSIKLYCKMLTRENFIVNIFTLKFFKFFKINLITLMEGFAWLKSWCFLIFSKFNKKISNIKKNIFLFPIK